MPDSSIHILINIFNSATNECIDSRTFTTENNYGERITEWLAWSGYNNSSFYAKMYFID